MAVNLTTTNFYERPKCLNSVSPRQNVPFICCKTSTKLAGRRRIFDAIFPQRYDLLYFKEENAEPPFACSPPSPPYKQNILLATG